MTDDADRAADYEERMRQAAIARRRPALKPCGHCYNCGESVRHLFCDADCALDYERRTRCSP